ncbi:ROK family protein [Streptomyces sp. NP160]|uniref:ROK family protein n=1 Tax=Streptomyces sp. NP160 TaxID=2586637 RepID=UPI001119A07B|nr:ROK family protein [Streptomyces sp. NP160]TNM63156.1 ROK family protein [Streptomyces sp. NP160]
MTGPLLPPTTGVPVVGIDIGGTASRTVVVRGDEVVASHIDSTPASPSLALDAVAGWVEHVVERAGLELGELGAIGIGASGPVDAGGVIRNPDTLPGLTGLDVVGSLTNTFGVPVVIDNDAAAAAIGEHWKGAGRGASALLVLTLGTGVGVAVVRQGRPFRGGDGLHPEAGHLTVPGAPALCYCGRQTCLEQTASRASLQNLAEQARGSTDLRELNAAATEGEAVALEVLTEYGRRVGDGLVELSTQHRPDVVVLAGSAAQCFAHFGAALQGQLAAMTSADAPDVRVTSLGDLAGAIGAARLAAPAGSLACA